MTATTDALRALDYLLRMAFIETTKGRSHWETNAAIETIRSALTAPDPWRAAADGLAEKAQKVVGFVMDTGLLIADDRAGMAVRELDTALAAYAAAKEGKP